MTKTYAQLTREIQALQAHAEKLRASEVKAAIARINETIAEYGLTPDDLRFPATTSAAPGAAAPQRAPRRKAAPTSRAPASDDSKFSDGQGHTWGGRGPRPAWLRQAIAQGRTLESFATTGPEGSAPAKNTKNAKNAKNKLPAVYADPKTGHAWSGRGPKPNWLKQALKKRGVSVEDFLLSAQEPAAEASKDAPAPASARRSKTGRGATATAKSPAVKAPKPARTAPARKNKAPARKNLPVSMAPSTDDFSALATERATPPDSSSGDVDSQGGPTSGT